MTVLPEGLERLDRLLRGTARRLLRPPLNLLRQYAPRQIALPPRPELERDPRPLPRIAIVTPSYNQGAFIRATVDSVLGQDYPALEYLVMDGGSGDDTAAVLAGYGERLAWVSEADQGQADAINKGFARIAGDVAGDIMGWVNSDDRLLPGTLALVGRFFRDNPQVDVVYGHRIVIDEDDREVGRWVLPRHDSRALAFSDYVPQETLFWRARVWAAVGPLDASYHYAMDWDFLLRAQAAGFRFRRLPHFLGCFRVHGEQKTARTTELTREMDRLRSRKFGRTLSQGEISRGLRGYLLRQMLCDWRYRLGRRFAPGA
jgi:glycosyltransferase involved in cell wall biosynthesis